LHDIFIVKQQTLRLYTGIGLTKALPLMKICNFGTEDQGQFRMVFANERYIILSVFHLYQWHTALKSPSARSTFVIYLMVYFATLAL